MCVRRSTYCSLLLQTIFIGIYSSTLFAELLHGEKSASLTGVTSSSGVSPSTPLNKNTVKTTDECKKYLCKYGYLTCSCHQSTKRRKRQLPEEIFPIEYNPNSLSTTPDMAAADETGRQLTSPSLAHEEQIPCTDSDFVIALKKFQKNYQLPVSGLCDSNTTRQMSQKRCGQPDTVIDKLEGEDDDSLKQVRKKRSLSDMIEEAARLEEAKKRRKQLFQQYMDEIKEEKARPLAVPKNHKRTKRSTSKGLKKKRVSWRLMVNHEYLYISGEEQRSIMRMAFRYWSEVIPVCFYEHKDSNSEADIEIGFVEGVHLNCYRQFDGYGGEIAHKVDDDLHFDSSEQYTVELDSSTRLSLLLVAAHEIGHVLGLNHSTQVDSLMHAIYHELLDGTFQLSDHDRRQITSLYGPCNGSFNSVFDFVRTDLRTNRRMFNSYFFREDHVWKYQNNLERTTIGDPIRIDTNWDRSLKNIDTFLHYYKYNTSTSRFYDEHLFFKGSSYYLYNAHTHVVEQSGRISQKYPSYNSTFSIPSNLDAAFFDFRRRVSLIYFFKGRKVYSYNYQPGSSHQCCTSVQNIVDLFPPATPDDLHSENSYETGIDTAYYSNSKRNLYFIKGDDVWVDELFSSNSNSHGHRMKYVGKWYNLWFYICDADCPA